MLSIITDNLYFGIISMIIVGVIDDYNNKLASGVFKVDINARKVLSEILLPKGEIAYISWFIDGKRDPYNNAVCI